MQNQTFQLLLDGVPYTVKAEPFTFNEGIRYNVHYNESPEFIFAWDDDASQYVAIDNESSEIPSSVETAIARELGKLNAKISV